MKMNVVEKENNKNNNELVKFTITPIDKMLTKTGLHYKLRTGI